MKLGIVVVYLVSQRNKQLLDLHLSQIERHTRVPFAIYASANRLLPELRRKLEQHPHVKICAGPTTELRGGEEHAFYLEHLVRCAVQEGASHIATLHVDSFPIRSGWAEELGEKLSDRCVLAAIMRGTQFNAVDRKPLSACMFFRRDFYLEYHPTFRLSPSEIASPEYKRYLHDSGQTVESGGGYGFKIHTEGLAWYPLLRSNRAEDHREYGHIYGDLIFHLGEAAWRPYYYGEKSLDRKNILHHFAAVSFMNRAKQTVRRLLPDRLRRRLWILGEDMITAPMYEHVRLRLLENPDAYLNYLRTGQPLPSP